MKKITDDLDENVVDEVKKITPLDLNIDLGRQDLNDMVGKIQATINELIEKKADK